MKSPPWFGLICDFGLIFVKVYCYCNSVLWQTLGTRAKSQVTEHQHRSPGLDGQIFHHQFGVRPEQENEPLISVNI